MENMTLETFQQTTGMRFRVTREQKKLIDEGVMSREDAFQEALESGEIQRRIDAAQNAESFWADPELSMENFKEKSGRRFRLDRDRARRVKNNEITRQEAFNELVSEKRTEYQNVTQ